MRLYTSLVRYVIWVIMISIRVVEPSKQLILRSIHSQCISFILCTKRLPFPILCLSFYKGIAVPDRITCVAATHHPLRGWSSWLPPGS